MRDPERGAAGIADDRQFEDVARGESQIGPEGYGLDHKRWRRAFPDGEVKITDVVFDGNRSVVEFVNRGIHARPVESSLGSFEPGGGRQETRCCSVLRVRDGTVIEGRDCDDVSTTAHQPGLVS
jgi:predicted ester cyclase